MTPYERIAIYQRLDHDRDVAERAFPCSTYTACAGIRNPTHKLCDACPLDSTPRPIVVVAKRGGAPRTVELRANRDFCECGRSKDIRARTCLKCKTARGSGFAAP